MEKPAKRRKEVRKNDGDLIFKNEYFGGAAAYLLLSVHGDPPIQPSPASGPTFFIAA
jgi:hypothetical protein